jgi:hypothetical protein
MLTRACFRCFLVAHRLRAVIDYDKLIVLDKVVIVEFDTPWNLIQKEDGIFRNMALKSGMFAELERIAKDTEMGNAQPGINDMTTLSDIYPFLNPFSNNPRNICASFGVHSPNLRYCTTSHPSVC